ncbi:MAG: hypothetical protein QW478_15155 [Candidatus Micrarchaeaceae archaeon]
MRRKKELIIKLPNKLYDEMQKYPQVDWNKEAIRAFKRAIKYEKLFEIMDNPNLSGQEVVEQIIANNLQPNKLDW